MAPILEGNFTHMIVQGATMLNSAVDLGSAGVDTFRAAAGTEAIIDAGLVLALIAQVSAHGHVRWDVFLYTTLASVINSYVHVPGASTADQRRCSLSSQANGTLCSVHPPANEDAPRI